MPGGGLDWAGLGVLVAAGGITAIVGATKLWLLASLCPAVLILGAIARRSQNKALEERRRLLRLLKSPAPSSDVDSTQGERIQPKKS